jgi:hypothetical protein
MKIVDRAMSIELLAKSLCESVMSYDDVMKEPNDYPQAGFDVSMHDSKTSIKRQITLLRSELLELSKEL